LKLLVIFNPNAANGRAKKLVPVIRQYLADHSVAADFQFTKSASHGSQLTAEANLAGYDGVVAAGGDGTLFEVLNGLYRQAAEARPPLGVLPIGTGNAFSNDLGLVPGQWQQALDLILRQNVRQVDVGQVTAADEEYYFLNIVGIGLPVDAGLTAKKLKFLGNRAYTLGTLWRVLGLRSYPLRLEIDGEVIEQDNVFVEVSNSRYTGTKFLIAPHAEIDDGLLDVTLVQKLSRLRVLKLFPSVYSGRHLEYEEVTTYKARQIRIASPEGMLMAPDGEFAGHTPAEIRCLHRALSIFRN